jgi:hypothetical protein
MPIVSPLANSTGSTPSLQPQVQAQGVANPGLSANQISLATPPASFSLGKRFFITEGSSGAYELKTVSTPNGQDGIAPNANPAISADALEVNASIAYAITTGQINPSSYMAEQNAKTLRLNEVVKHVGASPLQTASLAGEITGDQFDASRILQFLKKNKSQLDDSHAKTEASAHGKDLVGLSIIASLKQFVADYETNLAQARVWDTQVNTLSAQSTPDQTALAAARAQLLSSNTAATRALASAQELGNHIFANALRGGINGFKKDLEKLNKVQLAKLSDLVSKTVVQAITKQIDQTLLSDSPLGTPSEAPLVETRDGTVIKTASEQIKQSLIEQLVSEEFQQQLAAAISENSGALGLSDLNEADLKPATLAFAQVSADTIAQQSQFIDEAISDSDALLADVKHILSVELEGSFNRAQTASNV